MLAEDTTTTVVFRWVQVLTYRILFFLTLTRNTLQMISDVPCNICSFSCLQEYGGEYQYRLQFIPPLVKWQFCQFCLYFFYILNSFLTTQCIWAVWNFFFPIYSVVLLVDIMRSLSDFYLKNDTSFLIWCAEVTGRRQKWEHLLFAYVPDSTRHILIFIT